MAKRHSSLVLLSQDHHHGLALALRLRQGDNALLNDGWTHDRVEQARRVAEFFEKDLRLHFESEEEVLFPAIIKHIVEAESLIRLLVQQHRHIEQLISQTGNGRDENLDGLLRELGVLLEQHIRAEERELFPIYQARITPKTADGVERQIAARRRH